LPATLSYYKPVPQLVCLAFAGAAQHALINLHPQH